jgi:ABC-type polar amino acid transport system ATPase subunit
MDFGERHADNLDVKGRSASVSGVAESKAYPQFSTVPDLRAELISKAYGNTQVLKGISLHLRPAELVCIIGSSGCGKSTLLRCLNGLESVDSGSITLDGASVSPLDLRRRVGLVFQGFHLFPHLDVMSNLLLAPALLRPGFAKEDGDYAKHLLARVGVSADLFNRRPHQLSGGQQQRVAIARALALRPDAVLYDEPTSALDPERTADVVALIRDRQQEGLAQIVVTHDMPFARALACRTIHLDCGEVVADATDLLTAPRDERTQRFLRACLA